MTEEPLEVEAAIEIPPCGWTLQLTTPDESREIVCIEDQGHADIPHSDGETSWVQLSQAPPPEPDTEIELP